MKYKKLFSIPYSATILLLFSACSNPGNTEKTVSLDSVAVAAAPVDEGPLWSELPHSAFPALDTINVHYKSYKLLSLDSLKMQILLGKAPKESQRNLDSLKVILELPRPDSGTSSFSVYSTSVMDPALEAKFPQLKTYGGSGVDEKTASVRLDFNELGFHAYVFSQRGEWIIQPAAQGIMHRYLICFFKQDAVAPNQKPFELNGSPTK